jgi:DNA-binding response OmpR family regulator
MCAAPFGRPGAEMSDNQDSAVVLLVDDEELIVDVVADALREATFEVVTAFNAKKALSILNSSVRLRGLVTDVNLGRGDNGWTVARHARELLPGLPVIYVSGGSSNEWTSQGVPNSVMIQKPFVPAQILVALATLMNATDTPG